MQLEKGHLYHIYNQGNNRRRIFFSKQNYFYFIKKLKIYVKPYADVLAWCLMPNHFHLMVRINNLSRVLSITNTIQKSRSFNDSFGILLRSYTRAINKQEDMSGSLFRKQTKAICITCHNGITPSSLKTIYGISLNIKDPKSHYPQVCFDYIHNNFCKAGLVLKPTDWNYSSAQDYYGNRNGSLINKDLALKYVRVST